MLPVDTSRIDNGATYLAWNASLCRYNLSVTYEQAELCKNSTSHILIKIIFSFFCYTKRNFLSFVQVMGTEELPLRSQVSKQLVVNRDNAESEHYMNTEDIGTNLWNCEIWKDLILKHGVKATPPTIPHRFVHQHSASLSSQPASLHIIWQKRKNHKTTTILFKELFWSINCS